MANKKRYKRNFDFFSKTKTVLKFVLGISSLSFILIAGYNFSIMSPFFKIKDVAVSNDKELPEIDIADYADIYKGDNILSLNIEKVKAALEADEFIERVDIRKKFPSTLEISIKEHNPIGIVDIEKKYLMDNTGKIFMNASYCNREHFKDLTVITGLSVLDDIDDKGNITSREGKAVFNIMKEAINHNELIPLKNIVKIHIDKNLGIFLYAKDRVKLFKLGYDNIEKSYKRLDKIFSYIENNKTLYRDMEFEFIDLRNLDKIVVKPLLTLNKKEV